MFKNTYLSKLSEGGGEKSKCCQKRKEKLTLGELDGDVQPYLNALKKSGTVVNANIARAAAKRIVKAENHALLYENGSHIQQTTAGAYSLLKEWDTSSVRHQQTKP